VLEEALRPAVAPDEYLEAPTASCALAAAEVVAALAGRPRPALPEEVTAWVNRQSKPVDQGDKAPAIGQRPDMRRNAISRNDPICGQH